MPIPAKTGRSCITIKCGHCEAPFEVPSSRLKHGRGRHCSASCQYAAIKARPKAVVHFNCIGCGVGFTRPLAKTKQKGVGKYCTRECRDLHWIGDKNPLFQNANQSYKRGPRWFSIRRRILARDKCCQRCGASEQLHVHHIVPFRMWKRIDDANAETNLVALCPPCHRREDAKFRWGTPEQEPA